MKIVCTTAELLAMTRSCQSLRCSVFNDDGCEGCVLHNFCDEGEDHDRSLARCTFEEVLDVEVVVDG